MSERFDAAYNTGKRVTTGTPLNIQLVIEEHSGNQDWLMPDFVHWFSPRNVQIDLTQAVSPMSDTAWFLGEDRAYAETVVERQRLVGDRSQRLMKSLSQEGFVIQQDALTVMSDEGCQRLVEDLKEESPDLLVIGASLPASSFSLSLARKAPCSVLLLRVPLKSRIGRLVAMVATDGSDAAIQAARKLPELIQSTHLSVTIVNVQSSYHLENAVLAPFVNSPFLEEAMEENAEVVLRMTRTALDDKGVHVLDSIHLIGDPALELGRLADEKIEPDLIVVGAHNRTALSTWLLGSVSQRLLHDAPYNLLIVR